MRKVEWLLVVLVLAVAPVAALAGPAEDVSATVDRWGSAFNSNNVDLLVNLYAPDAILVGTRGSHPEGRKRRHQELFRPPG